MQHPSGKTSRMAMLPKKRKKAGKSLLGAALMAQAGYDPEMLFVECGRCGAPILWEPGRATELLAQAGVDPTELDASCILITDACPACASGPEFTVRIFRISDKPGDICGHPVGHA